MIRLTLAHHTACWFDSPALIARAPRTDPDSTAIASDPLDSNTSVLQARELVDAAAALLENETGYEDAFEALHDVLERLPGETRDG